ncbi:hypothetical protein BBJ28_00022345, partial [Nothophytophthora sp. Chile5]
LFFRKGFQFDAMFDWTVLNLRSGRRERGTSGGEGERSSARADVRQDASQDRVLVHDQANETPDVQLPTQYRSAGLRDDRQVAMDADYPAPRVATGSSRDALGAKPLDRQRY